MYQRLYLLLSVHLNVGYLEATCCLSCKQIVLSRYVSEIISPIICTSQCRLP
nr:MAG TPA: hypothetical protein [Caudoviricetes sp.]